MKECAYCDELCTPTREHIWPANLLRKPNAPNHALAPGGTHFYKGEPQVKDVCGVCNSDRLSNLDAYLSSIYDEHFGKEIAFRETTVFTYNYDLLLRSLLKISFNSHRGNNDRRQLESFKALRNYILFGRERPQAELRLQIVTKPVLTLGSPKILGDPRQYRSVMLNFGNVRENSIVSRLVVINSFWFFIVVKPNEETDGSLKQVVSKLDKAKNPSGLKVTRSNKLMIPWNKTTHMHPELWGQGEFWASGSKRESVLGE